MGVIAGYEETYLKHLECCLSCCIINAGVTSFRVDKTQVKPHQHVTNLSGETTLFGHKLHGQIYKSF